MQAVADAEFAAELHDGLQRLERIIHPCFPACEDLCAENYAEMTRLFCNACDIVGANVNWFVEDSDRPDILDCG